MAGSNFNNPVVDGIAAGRKLAPVIMRNVVQRVQLYNGKGVTEEFSDNPLYYEIRIVRIKPLTQEARTYGETTNGGGFNSLDPEQPVTESYGLTMAHTIDLPIDIAQSSMDMIPLDLLNGTATVLDQKIAKNVNASTMAEQLAKALNYQYNGGTPLNDHVVTATLGTTDLLDAFFDLSTILDNGDIDNGVDAFPLESRAFQIRPTVKNYFQKSGKAVYDLGNWKGQDMLKIGAFDPETYPNVHVDGSLGEINQTMFFVTPDAIWTLAEKYLGLTAGDLAEVYGILSSAEGTGRGIAFSRNIVVGQSPRGQGVRIYPLYRWGHETWFEKSVALLVKTGFTSVGTGALKVIGDGSR